MEAVRNLLRGAVDLVLPERCPTCGVIVPHNGFCSDCWNGLHFLSPPWCAGCARPFAYEGQAQFCVTCLASPPLHDGIRAAVAYNDISRQVALKLKYGGKIGLASMIAAQLSRQLPEDVDNLLVVPVPLHWTRLWARSFNQSALIAQALTKQRDAIYAPDLLIRTKRTPSLRGLSARERKRTVSKVFTINDAWKDRVRRAGVILVDDVLTTGATSGGCIRALKNAGTDWVQLFCWARVLPGEDQPDGAAYMVGA